ADRQQPRAPDEELEEVHHDQAQLQVHRTSPTRSRETRARLDVRQASVLNQCRPWTAVLSELSAPARVRREAQGGRANRDVGETGMPGAMVLATFAETKVAGAKRRLRQRAEPRNRRKQNRIAKSIHGLC